MRRLIFACIFLSIIGYSCGRQGDNRSSADIEERDSVDVELITGSRLSMNSVWDYYPESERAVSLRLQSEDIDAFNDEGRYSLFAIDDSVKMPTDNEFDIIYSKITDEAPVYEQNVILRNKMPFKPYRYMVMRIGSGDDTLVTEFRVVSGKEVNTLLKSKISDYFSSKNSVKNDTVACNVYSFGVTAGDSIEVDMAHDSPKMRELFYDNVLSYSVLKFTGAIEPEIYTGQVITDTLGVSMNTLESVYPDTVSEVQFVLHNNSGKSLCFGTPYAVARLVDGKWTKLYHSGIWNMPLFIIDSGSESEIMTAKLYRPINDISSGEYLIYKKVYFEGEREKSWTISARFSIK